MANKIIFTPKSGDRPKVIFKKRLTEEAPQEPRFKRTRKYFADKSMDASIYSA